MRSTPSPLSGSPPATTLTLASLTALPGLLAALAVLAVLAVLTLPADRAFAIAGKGGKLEFAIDGPWRMEPSGAGGGLAAYGFIPIQISFRIARSSMPSSAPSTSSSRTRPGSPGSSTPPTTSAASPS